MSVAVLALAVAGCGELAGPGTSADAGKVAVSSAVPDVLPQDGGLHSSTSVIHVEAFEEDPTPGGQPSLSIAGLGPNNSFVGHPLVFKLEGTPPLDLEGDSDGLITCLNKVEARLKDYWTFNPADNSFTVSGTKLKQLMAALPTGELEVSLNFVSKDGEFAAVYNLLAIGQGEKLCAPGGGADSHR